MLTYSRSSSLNFDNTESTKKYNKYAFAHQQSVQDNLQHIEKLLAQSLRSIDLTVERIKKDNSLKLEATTIEFINRLAQTLINDKTLTVFERAELILAWYKELDDDSALDTILTEQGKIFVKENFDMFVLGGQAHPGLGELRFQHYMYGDDVKNQADWPLFHQPKLAANFKHLYGPGLELNDEIENEISFVKRRLRIIKEANIAEDFAMYYFEKRRDIYRQYHRTKYDAKKDKLRKEIQAQLKRPELHRLETMRAKIAVMEQLLEIIEKMGDSTEEVILNQANSFLASVANNQHPDDLRLKLNCSEQQATELNKRINAYVAAKKQECNALSQQDQIEIIDKIDADILSQLKNDYFKLQKLFIEDNIYKIYSKLREFAVFYLTEENYAKRQDLIIGQQATEESIAKYLQDYVIASDKILDKSKSVEQAMRIVMLFRELSRIDFNASTDKKAHWVDFLDYHNELLMLLDRQIQQYKAVAYENSALKQCDLQQLSKQRSQYLTQQYEKMIEELEETVKLYQQTGKKSRSVKSQLEQVEADKLNLQQSLKELNEQMIQGHMKYQEADLGAMLNVLQSVLVAYEKQMQSKEDLPEPLINFVEQCKMILITEGKLFSNQDKAWLLLDHYYILLQSSFNQHDFPYIEDWAEFSADVAPIMQRFYFLTKGFAPGVEDIRQPLPQRRILPPNMQAPAEEDKLTPKLAKFINREIKNWNEVKQSGLKLLGERAFNKQNVAKNEMGYYEYCLNNISISVQDALQLFIDAGFQHDNDLLMNFAKNVLQNYKELGDKRTAGDFAVVFFTMLQDVLIGMENLNNQQWQQFSRCWKQFYSLMSPLMVKLQRYRLLSLEQNMRARNQHIDGEQYVPQFLEMEKHIQSIVLPIESGQLGYKNVTDSLLDTQIRCNQLCNDLFVNLDKKNSLANCKHQQHAIQQKQASRIAAFNEHYHSKEYIHHLSPRLDECNLFIVLAKAGWGELIKNLQKPQERPDLKQQSSSSVLNQTRIVKRLYETIYKPFLEGGKKTDKEMRTFMHFHKIMKNNNSQAISFHLAKLLEKRVLGTQVNVDEKILELFGVPEQRKPQNVQYYDYIAAFNRFDSQNQNIIEQIIEHQKDAVSINISNQTF